MTFIYTRVPAADLLPADGSSFRRRCRRRCKRDAALEARAAGHRQLRSDRPIRRRCSSSTRRRLNADLTRWTFLTGDRDEIDRFAARFGVSISRAMNDARDITHNLRTAIVDARRQAREVYTGNDWSPGPGAR